MIEFCDRCGGKIVRVKDGSTCACGAFNTRRAVAVIYPGGAMRLRGELLDQDAMHRELERMERG